MSQINRYEKRFGIKQISSRKNEKWEILGGDPGRTLIKYSLEEQTRFDFVDLRGLRR